MSEQQQQTASTAGSEKSEEEKARLKAEREKRKKEKEEAKKAKKGKADRLKDMQNTAKEILKREDDPLAHMYGDQPLCTSQGDPEERHTMKYVAIKDINSDMVGQTVRVRGRLHNSKAQKKCVFINMRESFETVQTIVFQADTSQGMMAYAKSIPPESIIEIVAKVIQPDQPIASCTIQMELHIMGIYTVNKSVPVLPFQLADASRRVEDQTKEDTAQAGERDQEETKDAKQAVVKQDVRLDNRVIDLRVPTNQAIMRLQSGVCQLFREYLYSQDFVEIHTPKLLGGTSEGGANVFRLKYFEKDACLAQSPQLHKQMALCGDLPRVMEIGPVFRAENSNTNRHLTEFTGLDLEMEFKNHYFEVLDLIGNLMVYMFKGMKTRYARELEIIHAQYPFEEFVCKEPVVKLHFKEGVKMLHEAGHTQQDMLGDLSTEFEKALGKLVREKYHTDFYILYGYPKAARPFYTMVDPVDPNYTNSYDLFMRGEEITSGAQRIHDSEMLVKSVAEYGIPPSTVKDYTDAFKYGAPNHAGAGFGLERVVKFFCNLHNIRKASLFPRDPGRLAP